MICNKCNAPVQEGEKFCPGCGNDLDSNSPIHGESNQFAAQPIVDNNVANIGVASTDSTQEKVNIWLIILSWFIPIAGIIIFFVKKNSSPKTAKASGICALISFLLNIVVIILCFGLLFGSFSYLNFTSNKTSSIENNNFSQQEEVEKDRDNVVSEDTENSNTQNDSANPGVSSVGVSKDWKLYQLGIKGKVYALPMAYSELATATGFSMKEINAEMILKNNYYAIVNLYKNNKLVLYTEVFNNSGVETKYVDCKVTRVSQTKYHLSQGSEAIVFPGGLKVGDTITDEQLVTLFGQPNDLRESGTSKQYVYLSNELWSTTNNFKIKVINGVIEEIQLDNRK